MRKGYMKSSHNININLTIARRINVKWSYFSGY